LNSFKKTFFDDQAKEFVGFSDSFRKAQ